MKTSRQQENTRHQEPQKPKPRRRKIDPKTGLTVLNYIGAKWSAIKNSLYDAGYQVAEVSRYRDELLDDFKILCLEHHLHGIV